MMRDTTLALGDGILMGKDPWELDYHVSATDISATSATTRCCLHPRPAGDGVEQCAERVFVANCLPAL